MVLQVVGEQPCDPPSEKQHPAFGVRDKVTAAPNRAIGIPGLTPFATVSFVEVTVCEARPACRGIARAYPGGLSACLEDVRHERDAIDGGSGQTRVRETDPHSLIGRLWRLPRVAGAGARPR